ncbi:hypothetical protein DSM112329_01892 [Paraconexibacter sp. AEG42_29]|uniref:Acyl-CoA dehydrogenase n=2 Tax=Paraconexibacter sp. AEG42_29 TaxID=2997339 RepID=A0AAU7ATX3_9ACTN
MDDHDRLAAGDFPEHGWALLEQAGLVGATASHDATISEQLALVRAVGRIDVSLGRVYDGHLNGVERLRVQVDSGTAAADLDAVARGALSIGVWGADPAPGEGAPAELRRTASGDTVLDGVKVFCSGAGGVDRAFVLARAAGDPGPVRLAYVDVSRRATVDAAWFGGAGMRGSASHRVVFHDARVLWTAPEPRALLVQPWFAGDGLRTAAGWAGGADAVVDGVLAALRSKPAASELEQLAVATLVQAQRSMDLWLRAGADAVAAAAADVADTTLLARVSIAADVRTILAEADRVLGSRPFAAGGRIERARRDLLTYLLQHRLEAPQVALGARRLAAPGA